MLRRSSTNRSFKLHLSLENDGKIEVIRISKYPPKKKCNKKFNSTS